MKFLVFGSLNIDHVYRLKQLVREGETVQASSHEALAGGKGLNQAVALSRAGQRVCFAGALGPDGDFLKRQLEEAGIDTKHLITVSDSTGHAVIQVDDAGRNSIIVFGGANHAVTPAMIEKTLSDFDPGDWLLMQNEISGGRTLLESAAKKGMRVAFNPSPDPAGARAWPLERAELLIFNELEGEELSGESEPEKMLDRLLDRCPKSRLVLTLGEKGSVFVDASRRLYQSAFPVRAVDTTAAGDTFTGFLLAALAKGESAAKALRTASAAAALAVSRPGATPSIPTADETEAFLKQSEQAGQ